MTIIALILLTIIIYHHLGYPILLKFFGHLKLKKINEIESNDLPSIHIVIPAYNEEDMIAQKINSLSWLDYPDNKLSISIYCDGCTDDTLNRAIRSQGQFYNRDLDIRIVNIKKNIGKVAIINKAIVECDEEILAFSDVSSILSSDTLRLTAKKMSNKKVAVVTGNYSLLSINRNASRESLGDSLGESIYWQYQNKIRSLESNLGAVMGVTGGYFSIKKECCGVLETDTINDDFILPMRAVIQGGLSILDSNIRILETEATPLEQDAQRRLRISQGNMQQVIRLKSLLFPGIKLDRAWASWMFFSGKFLRVSMPYLLISLLMISATLAIESILFMLLFIAQTSVYFTALIHQYYIRSKIVNRISNNKLVKLVSYLCQGHLMGLIGSASYLHNSFKQQVFGIAEKQYWHKIIIKNK